MTTVTLHCEVSRGKHQGAPMRPARYEDGQYVASPTRFEKDYVRVGTLHQLIELWRKGYHIRMKADGCSPSLKAPQNLTLVEV